MAINLGNIVSVDGKNVGSGISSGLDAASLIEGLIEAKRIPITGLEDTISVNSEKLTAFGELRSLTESLSSAASFMRNKPGFGVEADNIFNYRTSSLVSNSSVSAANYLSIASDPGAPTGNYDIQIGGLAKALRTESTSFTGQTTDVTEAASGSTAGLFSAGTFQLTTTAATLIGDTLSASEYTVDGAGDGVNLTAAGIHNLVIPTDGGLTNFSGVVSGFDATAKATDLVDITVDINGTTFSTFNVDASSGGRRIASGTTITFSDGNGTRFDIITAQNFDINEGNPGTEANLLNFEAALDTALASQSIYQSRELANFTDQTSGLLSGLDGTNTQLYSDGFNPTTGTHGSFGEFTVTAVSDAGVNDASISVVIDGETYEATTIGADTVVTTHAGDILVDADYSVNGAIVGTTLGTGISNIVADVAGGDTTLMGTISGFGATWNDLANDTVDLAVTINGTAYTAAGVAADTGGGLNEIASGTTITFTDGAGNSFDIITGDAAVIGSQVNADTFAANLDTALASQSIFQNRVPGIFDSSQLNTTQTSLLTGFDANDFTLSSDSFTVPAGTHGVIDGFEVTAVTGVGNGDGIIRVVIDGETYEATGLGNGTDNVTTNIVLASTTTDKEFRITVGDAAGSLNLTDAASATALEDTLNSLFKVDLVGSNITLNSTTTNKSLDLNLADAGIDLNFGTTTTASAIEAALDTAFGANSTSITINEDDSLANIASAINAKTSTSNVQANIIQVNTNDYRLVLESTESGVENQFSIVDSTGALTEASFTTTQSAANSNFQVNGIEVERTSNSVNDVIDKLTFNLLQITPDYQTGSATEISATIENDLDTVEAAIINFIDAYNNFQLFTSKQNQRGDDLELTEGAVLGRNSSLQTLGNQIINELNSSVSGADNADFARLSSLGITFTDFVGDDENPATANILTYDPFTLKQELANNFEATKEIFEFQFNASTSNIARLASTNDITLTDFKIDIDTGRAEGNEVRILDTDGAFLYNATLTASGSSYKITGQDGTTIEGLDLIYTGDGTETIDINLSTGIADRLFNIYEGYISEDGVIDTELDNINDHDTRLQEEIDKLEARIEKFRDDQLILYTNLEAAVTKVNTLLDFLDAQSKSMFGDS